MSLYAPLQIMAFSCFLTTPAEFDYGFINCLASDHLLCHFHKKLIICEVSLVLPKQIIFDLVLSCILIEYGNPFCLLRRDMEVCSTINC